MADYSSGTDDTQIKEMRESFEFAWNEGADNRKERAVDLKYIAGDPWPQTDKDQRNIPGAERPCLVFDELNQYTNLVVNQQMQARLGIKVVPEGDGSNDKTAEMEANTIRGIEYRSNAQLAYTSGFEGAVWGGFGAWKVSKKYLPGSWDQDLCIDPIYNADSCIIDGESVAVDGSDMKRAWIINRMPHKEFERKFPKAKYINFTSEQVTMAPMWFGADDIQLAEAWHRKMVRRKLLQIQMPGILDQASGQMIEGPTAQAFEDELKQAGADINRKQIFNPKTGQLVGSIVRDRWDEKPEVSSCLTNGLEILEETPWDGQWIPIIPCYGKILWVDYGSGPKRVLQSLIRLARDPQMALNYTKTAIVELIGMMPKSPWMSYENQFENHEDEIQAANKIPKAFLQAKATTDELPGVLLPLPSKPQYSPDVAAAEASSETFRRAIQAAVGQNALPSSAQARNEKSGVALSRIAEAQAIGSYHFARHYEMSIAHTGMILEDLLAHTYDTPRTLGMRKEDGSYEMAKTQEGAFKAKHGVTISSGPSSQSQREAVEKVAGDLMNNEQFAPRVAWLAIKLLNLGPLGDQISDLLKPPDIKSAEGMNPQQIQQKIQEQQQDLERAQQLIQKLDSDLKDAETKLEGKEFETAARTAIADKQDATTRWKALLEAKTKVTLLAVQARLKLDEIAEVHDDTVEEIEVQGEVDEDLAKVQHEHATDQMETAADLAPEPKESE